MAKFVLLYTGGKMPETEAESAQVLKLWGAWYTSLGSAVVDPGNPFSPHARTIHVDGKMSDVPAGGMASGYSILEASSLDEALGMAKKCPVMQAGGEVSVYETLNIM